MNSCRWVVVGATLTWKQGNAGDWHFHGFNTDPPFDAPWKEAWSSTEDAIADAVLEDETDRVAPRFLTTVCRTLIAMERSGSFDCLRRDPAFKTLVIDHDESQEDAWERLHRARIRAAG